jgi:hypothetical protein
MEVLQTIHTHGDSRSTQTWNSLPLSQKRAFTIKEEIVIDSDDEDKADEKRNQFGSRLSSFCFDPAAVPQPLKIEPTLQKDIIALHTPLPAMKGGKLSPPQHMSTSPPAQEAFNAPGPSTPSYSARQLPDLPDSLVSTLRAFPNCPLCLQPFPNLSAKAKAEPQMKKFNAKKAAAKLEAQKKAKVKVITGAARLTHVQLCAYKSNTSSDVVISLVAKEQIRLDRNKRKEYNEEVSKEGIWKTLTGDAPPSTQVQQASVKVRGKRRGKPVEVKTPKGKAVTTSAAFKAGKRGGLNRATTLIMAPKLTRALVKQRCIELFGTPESTLEGDDAVYEDHVESTIRCQRAASSGKITLGLGVGACSIATTDHEIGATSRLGMGYSLGTVIAKRFKPSH